LAKIFQIFYKNLLKGGETCRSGHFLATTPWYRSPPPNNCPGSG